MLEDYRLGDWVQATSQVFDGEDEVARAGDIGHVVGPEEPDGWANVFFERTRRVNLCFPEQLCFLGDAETGKNPTEKKRGTHVGVN